MTKNDTCKPDWDGFREGPLWNCWYKHNSGKYYPLLNVFYNVFWSIVFFCLAAICFMDLVEFLRGAPYGLFAGLFALIGLLFLCMAGNSYFLYAETLSAWKYVLRHTEIRPRDEFCVVYKKLELRYEELERAMSHDKWSFIELHKHYKRLHLF